MLNFYLQCFAALLYVFAFITFRKSPANLFKQGLFFLLSFVLVIFFISYIAADYFTGNGIDESVIFHLKHGLQGAGFKEYASLIIASVAFIGGGIAALLYGCFYRPLVGKRSSFWCFLLIFIALLSHPFLHNLASLLARSPIINADVFDEDFHDYYLKPQYIADTQQRKNLVLIYAESLEYTYFDQTLFPNLMPNLTALQQHALVFPNIHQAPNTGFTIAGIVASLCGVPLFFSSHGNSLSGMDQFMPSAFCATDLLKEAGYNLHFMAGANSSFAGKGKFFETHGFSVVEGSDQLSAKLENPEYLNSWGLYDDSLLPMVLERFHELSAKNEPFALVTLTLDTHHPKGHPTESCKHIRYQDGKNDLLNSVACADYLLANFIEQIRSSEYADNTLIVLVSDHLALNGQTSNVLRQKAPEPRTNLFMVFDTSQDVGETIPTKGSTLDISSTFLPLLGMPYDIGLGRNLLVDNTETRDFIFANVKRWQKPITDLWHFPQFKVALEIDPTSLKLRIDQRQFGIPALITLDDDLKTTLYFEFDRLAFSNKTLQQHWKELANNTSYLWIDRCNKLGRIDKILSETFCLEIGIDKRRLHNEVIHSPTTYSAEYIQQLLQAIHFKAKPIHAYTLDELSAALQSDISILNDKFIYALDFTKQTNAWIQLAAQYPTLTLLIEHIPSETVLAEFNHLYNQLIPIFDNPYSVYRDKDFAFDRFIWKVPRDMHDPIAIAGWRYQLKQAFAIWLSHEQLSEEMINELNAAKLPLYLTYTADQQQPLVNKATQREFIYSH